MKQTTVAFLHQGQVITVSYPVLCVLEVFQVLEVCGGWGGGGGGQTIKIGAVWRVNSFGHKNRRRKKIKLISIIMLHVLFLFTCPKYVNMIS